MSPRVTRSVLVVLLAGGVYLALLPWATCAFSLGRWVSDVARICAFGSGNPEFDRTVPHSLWPYLVVAAIYLAAAFWVGRTKRVG